MTTVSEAYDASSRVRTGDAPAGTMGAYIDGLKDDCGLIIGSILSVVESLTGYDLLEELLKPIAGDFDAISSMQAGWREVSAACEAVGENYSDLATQLPPGLEGLTEAAAAAMMGRIAEAHDGQREAADLIAVQMDNMIEVSQATAECVCAALQFIDSVIQEILMDAAVPVVGWAKGAATAPGKVRKVIKLISDGKDAIQGLIRAVKACVTALKYLNALLDTANNVLSLMNAGGDVANSSGVDETARAGF